MKLIVMLKNPEPLLLKENYGGNPIQEVGHIIQMFKNVFVLYYPQ